MKVSFVAATLLAGLAAAGCNQTCVSFTSNPPNSTVNIKAGSSKPACTLTTAKSAVSVAMIAAPMCPGCSGSSSVQHIFVSLRGIEAHASGLALDPALGDAGWAELAPQLAQQPVQLDLMARPAPSTPPWRGAADGCAPGALGEGAVTAGVYGQIRLRLVPNHPAPGEAVPEQNACGKAGFNCVVAADGRIQPLALEGGAPQLPVASSRIVGGSLLVLPDMRTNLALEFNPYASLLLPAGDGVRLLPAFTAVQETACP